MWYENVFLKSFLKETFFKMMLIRECKRTERTDNNSFNLVLIDFNRSARKGKIDDLRKINTVIMKSIRESDIIGWYKQGMIIGIIYTDVSIPVATLFPDRIRDHLLQALPYERVEKIFFLHYQIPDNFMAVDFADNGLFNLLTATIDQDFIRQPVVCSIPSV